MKTAVSSYPTMIHQVRPDAFRTTVASSPQEMAQYASAWDELLLQQPFPLPMSSSAWVRSHAEYQTDANETIHCIFAHLGDRMVGVLPVSVRKTGGTAGKCLAAPLGQHARSIDMTLAPDCAAKAAEVLLNELQTLCPRWQSLGLPHVSDQSVLVTTSDSLGSALSLVEDSGRGAFVDTSGDYKTYLDSLSHNFSRNLRRVRSKLETDYLIEFQFVTADPDSVDLLEDFLRLEASGWKGSQGTAINGSPELHQFYTALAERMAERGWLEYHRLMGDGRVMASHLAVRYKRTVILLKIAYDEQFSSYAPGNVLMQEVMRRSFEDPNIDEVNCLTDMVWNTNWKMCYHRYMDITLFPRRPLTLLAGYYPKVVRERIKRIGPIQSSYNWLKQRLNR